MPVHLRYNVGTGQPIHGGRFPGGRLSGAVTLAAAIAAGTLGVQESALAGNVLLDPAVAAGTLEGHVWPTWRAAIAPFTWGIATSSKLEDLQAGLNLITPAGADWRTRGMTAGIMSAWVGTVWDESLLEARLINGGGHTDYGGNEGYGCAFGANSPSMRMLWAPSGALPGPAITTVGDGLDFTACYSDGRLRASHTYAHVIHIPGRADGLGKGDYLTRMSSVHYSGNGNIRQIRRANPDGTNDLVLDYTAFTGAGAVSGSGAGMNCWDPDTDGGVLWITNKSTDAGLFKVTPTASGPWDCQLIDQHTITPYFGDQIVYAGGPLRSVVAVSRGDVAGVWRVGAGATNQQVPTVTGARSAGFAIRSSVDGFGACWCPDYGPRGAVAVYQQTSLTTEITVIEPTSDNTSLPWARTVIPVDPGNTVVPPVSPADGLMTRFWYSSRLKGFFAWFSTTQPVYFFAIA